MGRAVAPEGAPRLPIVEETEAEAGARGEAEEELLDRWLVERSREALAAPEEEWGDWDDLKKQLGL